jgi:hypothetical protein
MSQGLIYISTGVLVVLVILVSLVLSVELIVRYDNFMRDRARRRKAEAKKEPDPSKVPAEVVAAIGMGLHQYFLEQSAPGPALVVDRRKTSAWSASGRADIMAERRSVTGRVK